MEVPCCFGLNNIVQETLGKSGKNIPIQDVTITIGGEKKEAAYSERKWRWKEQSEERTGREMFKSFPSSRLLFF